MLPGLIDIHSHGAVGCDFSDADVEGLKKILAYERAHGITSYCPTSMTLPKKQLFKIFDSAAEILKAEQAFNSSQDAGKNVSSSSTSEAGQARSCGQSKPASSDPLAHLQALTGRSLLRSCQEGRSCRGIYSGSGCNLLPGMQRACKGQHPPGYISSQYAKRH